MIGAGIDDAPRGAGCGAGPTGAVLGRLGGLVARLATSEVEVRAAQRLRYRVFVEECGAARTGREMGVEADALDADCDHLLVIDPAREDGIVGTYRLLTQERAAERGGFYSAAEFDVDAMVARHPDRRFLELGRSCVLAEYRDRRTIELLWQGIWAYALGQGTDVMFGCVSLPGTDMAAHEAAFSILSRHFIASAEWRVAARGQGVAISRAAQPCEVGRVGDGAANGPASRSGLRGLPPLAKGYLRLGGRVGPEAVIDEDFGCTDLMMLLPHEAISPRYIAHYGAGADRFV